LRLYIILIPLTILALAGCGPKVKQTPVETKPPVEVARCRPHSLTVDSLGNHYARIAWNPGCSGTRIMQGYNIYLSRKSMSGTDGNISPYNQIIYPGDTEGRVDRESFEFKELTSATRYFARVRAVYDDNTLSPATNEVEIICYPHGEIALSESYSGKQDGFSFEKSDYCKTDAMENDLYYYSKDGHDFLCSPTRISRVNRKTEFFAIDKQGTMAELAQIEINGKGLDKVEILPGTALFLKTADGNKAVLKVVKCVDTGTVRKATIQYYYLPQVQ
jgi:hypothetical protein